MVDESLLQMTIRKLDAEWSKSDRIYRWMFTVEQGVPHIKRNVKRASGKKTFQRLPRRLYGKLPEQELRDLVKRLNYNQDREKRMREKFKIDSAFIPNAYLEEFHNLLNSEIPTPEVVQGYWSLLERHFLRYFIQFSPNPVEWHSDHQAKWCRHLLESGLGPRTLRAIVQISNRFIRFMNKKRPGELPLLDFEPISKAQFRLYQIDWQNNPQNRKRGYISEKNYKKIVEKIPDEIRSLFILCYKFGLRRGEAMGLYQRLECVRKDYLAINDQVKRFTRDQEVVRGATKGRTQRKVPYWYSTPAEAYKLIQGIVMMAPDECSRKFNDYCKTIGLDFTLHDCRHTFVTNAVNDKDKKLNEVRLAVGHKDLRVTSAYLRDNTEFSDDVWVPGSDAEAA